LFNSLPKVTALFIGVMATSYTNELVFEKNRYFYSVSNLEKTKWPNRNGQWNLSKNAHSSTFNQVPTVTQLYPFLY
jgi:hypothetical protein